MDNNKVKYVPRLADLLVLVLDPSRGGKSRKLDNLLQAVNKASVRYRNEPVTEQAVMQHLTNK
jgi:hypothetical protein